jgi:hypothetical protein
MSDLLTGFALVDRLSGVVDLLARQLRFSAKLHFLALRCFYSSAGPF